MIQPHRRHAIHGYFALLRGWLISLSNKSIDSSSKANGSGSGKQGTL